MGDNRMNDGDSKWTNVCYRTAPSLYLETSTHSPFGFFRKIINWILGRKHEMKTETNGYFIALDNNGKCMYSVNGIEWGYEKPDFEQGEE